MINNVVLMGRMTADAVLRTTTSGTSVASFTVAVDRNYKEKQTDFINIVAWKNTAEFVSKYFHKGDMIAVEGSIQIRAYEDKNGNKRTATEVIANNVSFCGGKTERKEEPKIDIDTFEEIPDDEDLDLRF